MPIEATEEHLSLLMQGHLAFQTLYAGYKLGVFSHLSAHPGTSQRDLADALRLAERPATFLVGSLRTLGLIVDSARGLRNAPIAESHLVGDRPDNYGPILEFYQDIVYPAAPELTASLRHDTNQGVRRLPGDGDTLYERLTADPARERAFHRGMSAISRIAITGLIDTGVLVACRHLLDVGGGDGTNAIALARAYPDLTVTVIDLPTVLDLAADSVTRSGLAGRISLHPCDIFADPFPEVDAVLFAHFMPIFSPDENRLLLRRAHQALRDGGTVLICNTMRNDTEDGPIQAMLFSAYFLALASSRGTYHPWAAYEGWLAEAGFHTVRRFTDLPFYHGLITASR